MSSDDVLWLRLGLVIRQARHRAGLVQRAVAERAGVSRSMVSRIELGHGAGFPIDTWQAVSAAVDAAVTVEPRSPKARPFGVTEVTRYAEAGGWRPVDGATWPIPGGVALVLEREPLPSVRFQRPYIRPGGRVLVCVVEVLGDLDAVLAGLSGDIKAQRPAVPTGWSIGGMIVVRRTEANLRRLRADGAMGDRLPIGEGGRWIGALRKADAPMPLRPAVVLMDRAGQRLTVLARSAARSRPAAGA
jgi:transcriptional regulator with XRE-family HTH domain